MKIVTKTYILIGVILGLAVFTLVLSYVQEQATSSELGLIIAIEDIIKILLGIDIAILVVVFYIISQSLSPLESISKALSGVRKGVYGKKIEYSGSGEIEALVENFNIMSTTIKEKEEEAKRTEIAKSQFLAMITHELKTPLVPIQGYSDMLLSEHFGKLTDTQRERIAMIKSSSEVLLSLIMDLLDAEKLELGELRMKKEDSNIKDTIDLAIETLKPKSEKENIKISSNAVDFTINHDSERIGQVITNLIKNSFNVIKSGSGKIELIMEILPTEIKISVKDNGTGIPVKHQKHLFKKFYQIDSTRTRSSGGSGLGLAICKGIVKHHGGQISVYSIPNQGATFSFTISKETS